MAALRPEPTDYVVEKHRYSAFIGTPLDLILKGLRARTVIVTGTATDVCVEYTVADALMHDYHIVVVEDCVASTRSENHRASLSKFSMFFGTVIASDDILKVWYQKSAGN